MIYSRLIVLLTLIIVQHICLYGQSDTVKPVIDGIIHIDEWKLSEEQNLVGGDAIYIQQIDDTLYVAIRGASGGFTSLGLANESEILILHSSTGLITAKYSRDDASWTRVFDFKQPLQSDNSPFPRNELRLSENYKNAQMKQFGWYANLIDMGPSTETEFIIPISILPSGENYISVVFYQIKASVKNAVFPHNLNDDMLNGELISGSAPANLNFSLIQWHRIKIHDSE